MHAILDYVLWYPSPEIFPGTSIPVRWYGLLFACAFIFGQMVLTRTFKGEGKDEGQVDRLVVYIITATILGARLGHVFFYEPAKYLANPIDIIKIWEGGLASHGAAFAIIITVWLYCNFKFDISLTKFNVKKQKREGQSFFWVIDRLVISVALAGAFIRMGNFMNSEIIGKPTDSESGVVFAHDPVRVIERNFPSVEKVSFEKNPDGADIEGSVPLKMTLEFKKNAANKQTAERLLSNNLGRLLKNYPAVTDHVFIPADQKLKLDISQKRGIVTAVAYVRGIPRYPSQLFEAASCVLIFLILYLIWNKYRQNTPQGLLFGIFLVSVFGLRFLYEFFKENQVSFEDQMTYNMGQLLSVPLLAIGFIMIFYSLTKKRNIE
ncbi:hypothetical protein FUAX_30840 [Fulvitalea axinellae]|uniref:Phosphatidylglycerol--prolipoprotein diacylglyceryl transferase n=1 Tax=Fulvitalea axinellae TaxID=1182444 RepID=A0AAU9CUB2_9BACT|nr:hypothetical protein FUAX_30840 [Fulvitalea axinellae]